jgi:hypothetical protein
MFKFYTLVRFTVVPTCQQAVNASARMILFSGESLFGRPSEVAGLLGQELVTVMPATEVLC